MKDFEYRTPKSISEAVALLAEKNGRSRVLAGGTDLIVQLRIGRVEADRIVDAKNISGLTDFWYDTVTGLHIGSAVSCCRLYEDETVVSNYPGLVDAVRIVGGIQIQSRASLGGNLCNASPSGDTIPALIALGATAVIAGADGTRTVPVETFCTSPGRSVLRSDELLVQLRLPPPKPHGGAYYLRFIPRNEMDIAVVGAGASVVLSEDLSTFVEARVALAAVAPTPLYVPAAGAALVGKPVTEDSIALAAAAAKAACTPISDMRGTAEQRRHLAAVLTTRALRGAIDRARGETTNGH